jgi:hypothetical protein
MKCPSCNKFAAYDTSAEPETELEVGDDLQVTGTIRIVLTAECCGDELKEATFKPDLDFSGEEAFKNCQDKEGNILDGHEFSVETTDLELTERMESTKTRTKKDGTVITTQIPFRYQRRFFGASCSVQVTCSCGASAAQDFSDEIRASAMDELT